MRRRAWRTGITTVVVSGLLGAGVITSTWHASATATVATPLTSASATARVVSSASALDELESGARFSVSVLDVDSGESLTHGEGSFDTASIVKVDILAALLLQHQDDGTEMSVIEQTQAAAMIEQSDNEATTALFEKIGGKAGLEEFNETIGMTDTVVGSDGYWGLTRTTAADQAALLEVVFGADSVLTGASQAYEQGLMTDVIDGQRFGVSAAADDPDDAALKVGFLQRSTTGLWDVTSIGEIEAGGHTYLVAVLSDGNASYDGGVTLVDEVAMAAINDMTAI